MPELDWFLFKKYYKTLDFDNSVNKMYYNKFKSYYKKRDWK